MPTLIKPFRGLRPVPEHAADVAAPPYDVLSTEEARERASGRPYSFLHVSKPEIDLPPGTDPYAPEVYAQGADNLRHMIDAGILVRDEISVYYVYRLQLGDHVQTGLVCTASIAAYDANRIRKHELTRPWKEDDRVRQITALNAQTGPVMAAYRATPSVRTSLHRVTIGEPVYDLVADHDVRHTFWVLADGSTIAELSAAFDAMDALYIADGHHRTASASRVAAARRAKNPQHTGEESYEYFLCVLFPQDETRILDYNRVIRDLHGQSPAALLERITERFDLVASDAPVRPRRPAQFGMYLDRAWYELNLHAKHIPTNDPVRSLDVSLLQDNLIGPLLGVHDQSTDARIDFVGGIRGLEALARRVDSGQMAIAFALFPTSMEALMAVADAHAVMPPKSTWFEPKLADGLVSHVLD